MNPELPLATQIDSVERNLVLRRQRLALHWHELRDAGDRARAGLPVALAVVSLVAGIAAGRRPTAALPPKLGLIATLRAMIGVALSPLARALWTAWRNQPATYRQ